MATLDVATLSVSALAGRVSQTFARHGEPAEDLGRDVSGFTLAFGAPLPGPAWLRAVRLGGVAYVPAAHLLRIRAAERVDVPQAPLYGDRLDHVAATLGGALSVGGWGGLGVGVTLTPDLEAPTKVRYDAGRGDTPEDRVVLHVDRELAMRAALTAGVRVAPMAGWALGAAWRRPVFSRAQGDNDTVAGSLTVSDRIDFHQFFSPEELAVGLVGPVLGASISVDFMVARWSDYRTIHDEAPAPRFEDARNVRVGLEGPLAGVLTARAGWAWQETPVPAQVGPSNFLDADRHVLAAGVGVRPAEGLIVDLHLRTHLLAEQRVDKSPTGDAPIVDLGYPGFVAQGGWWEAGLTVTLQ